MDGAPTLAIGGNFYALQDWKDADWATARDAIKSHNNKDRAARS